MSSVTTQRTWACAQHLYTRVSSTQAALHPCSAAALYRTRGLDGDSDDGVGAGGALVEGGGAGLHTGRAGVCGRAWGATAVVLAQWAAHPGASHSATS